MNLERAEKGSSWEAGIFLKVKVKASWVLKRFSVTGGGYTECCRLVPAEVQFVARRTEESEEMRAVNLAQRHLCVIMSE